MAAITYYIVGIIGYLAKALKAAGLRIDPDARTTLIAPEGRVITHLEPRSSEQRIEPWEAP